MHKELCDEFSAARVRAVNSRIENRKRERIFDAQDREVLNLFPNKPQHKAKSILHNGTSIFAMLEHDF